MPKDILLAITGTRGDANALAAAAALAGRLDAHLCALVMVNLPLSMPLAWGAVPDAGMARVHDELRDRARARAAEAEAQMARAGISFEVRIAESQFTEPPHAAAVHARYADLAVMTLAEGDADSSPLVRRYFASLLMESGRPVLVIPPQCTTMLPIRHAVVAWRPTQDASRAVHDAIPLLQLAESVDVVEVAAVAGDSSDGDLPGADIAVHLARHGLNVRVVALPKQEGTAAALLRHAGQSSAQLMVAGGYGHSRLRQWALGGVTRDLLTSAHLPVLFSH